MLLFTAPRDALLAPLQSVSGIVEKRHTLPILSNVLIEKKGEALTLLATDIEIQIRNRTTAALGAEDVAITVGARKLQDILRALPDSAEVQLTLDDKRITLKAGKSRFQLQTLPAADYPRLAPPEGEGVHFSTTQKAFKKQLALVQYAMAQQDIRYYLNGLLLVVAGGTLRMVATDGHRLAYAASAIEGDYPRTDVILPRKTVVELARQLADSDDPVEVTLVGNQIVFRFGHIELISKLIDGKFPDYERVIPQHHPKLVKASRLALLQSLQRAAILTNEKFRGVRLILSEGSLKLVSTNAEQEEAQEELEVDYSGDALDIGFNVTYLLDVLTNLSANEIEIRFNDNNASALFGLGDNPDFKYVVMPMRI
ncbi:MAG TPA: DNA polymerase III subunit beta [Zoogloea sp.]|uniref:DNA polymerase III subunit beta n=1 Tax=Zoogloea sp. TaxID=49181 RepID=UPI002CCEE5F1|nr:DNA polymerase III subunit beta [Zoogloea sp.]HMV19397.1 DNA polymerase III subunit beta [Rhodocyclaceae bacterium]HMV64941.1 DNA polymerase III subunit beta [Rhodocyclaceae bacterium]HMW53854.1 DNA polymerase III subunit beta [Rhodocyclaceae bacterium]HMZ75139.1 DNA polymerase III subunit beta [Rhodocyclaceae bacterium]HNA67075.1 DNA polymerase III subunit beta [Rhodocyclaceae bacterium]